MKQNIFAFLSFALCLTACNSNDSDNSPVLDGSAVKMTFAIQGDFTITTHDMTRTTTPVASASGVTRALTADGKDMTDLWVLDYVGTVCQQSIHQTSADADFGMPTLSLTLGDHNIYFIASRGSGATLNTDALTLTFGTVRDTFWKDYAITINGGTSSGSRAVALDRVVTKLKLVFSDAIPTGAATFSVTPATWYYGFNYQTGEPTSAANNQTTTVSIPSTEIGVVNETVSVFGFSSSTEWTTDIAINCKSSSDAVLGSATITAAPFVRNRVSEYTGPLFGDNGSMTLSLNVDWNDSYKGTW